jgi:hypothetical protein
MSPLHSIDLPGAWNLTEVAASQRLTRYRGATACRSPVPLEVLHLALVLFGLFQGCEGPQVSTLALFCILLRVQSKLSGIEFANHAGCRIVAGCVYLLRRMNHKGPSQWCHR